MCGCLTAGASLQAHHSLAGVYDMKAEKDLSGSVESVKFVNPHGSFTIAVKNPDGTSTNWVMTLGSATGLAQRGIGKTGPNALQAGETYDYQVHPGPKRRPARVPEVGDVPRRAPSCRSPPATPTTNRQREPSL